MSLSQQSGPVIHAYTDLFSHSIVQLVSPKVTRYGCLSYPSGSQCLPTPNARVWICDPPPTSQALRHTHPPIWQWDPCWPVHAFPFCRKVPLCHLLVSREKAEPVVFVFILEWCHLVGEFVVPSSWLQRVFLITQWIYYIYICTITITTQYYRISIPQPQHIPPPPELSPLETISFSKSVSQYLFCKEVHCVLFSDSTCQWKHLMLGSYCMTDFT